MPFFSFREQILIDREVEIFEHVEDDAFDACVLSEKIAHGLDGDLGGAVVWEAENAGGNAAESDAFEIIFGSEGEAAFVAAGELGFVLRRQRSVDDGTDGVENIARWQIVARCDLG